MTELTQEEKDEACKNQEEEHWGEQIKSSIDELNRIMNYQHLN